MNVEKSIDSTFLNGSIRVYNINSQDLLMSFLKKNNNLLSTVTKLIVLVNHWYSL